VVTDPRYLANLTGANHREGHSEGTVRAHIAEIEPNLEKLRPKLQPRRLLEAETARSHPHAFTGEAQPHVPIADPRSHASLAQAFLAIHCADDDRLAMVKYHDEPFAFYRQVEAKGKYNQIRFAALMRARRDWKCSWLSTS
jgi:hypothetical protein